MEADTLKKRTRQLAEGAILDNEKAKARFWQRVIKLWQKTKAQGWTRLL